MATLLRLSMETCAGSSRPWSFSRPACSASSCALVISVIIQASFSCTSWCEAMGRSSNCLRRMRVLARGFVAVHGRADHAPADAVARLRQARQRPLSGLWRRAAAFPGDRGNRRTPGST